MIKFFGIKDKCCKLNNMVPSQDPKYYSCIICKRIFTVGVNE